MKLLIEKTNNKISNIVKLEMLSTEFNSVTKLIKENEIPVVVFTDTSESYLINNINELINNARNNTEVSLVIVLDDLISLGGNSGDGIESISGDFVNNTDPLNPEINVNEANLGQVINDRLSIKMTPSPNDEILMLDSITGEAVTAYFSSLNGTPLSGTTEGNPVTGDIELQGERFIGVYGGDGFALLSFNDSENETQLTRTDSDGIYQNSITLATSADNNNTVISSNNPSSEGLVGDSDYTPNITELAYTQKKYVDTQSQVSSATSGAVNLDSGKRDLVFIHEAGATTVLTLNLPTSPKNNQKVTIMSVGGIVGLTLATAVGTIVGAVTTLAALGSVKLIWNSGQNKWYRI